MESMDIYEELIREEQEEKEATYNEVCKFNLQWGLVTWTLNFEYGCMPCSWFGFAFALKVEKLTEYLQCLIVLIFYYS